MLQQTTVKTVIPYYQKFIKKWPNIESFFNAELERNFIMWQGLGYYQRANNLFKAKEFLKKNKLKINSKEFLKKFLELVNIYHVQFQQFLNDENVLLLMGILKEFCREF